MNPQESQAVTVRKGGPLSSVKNVRVPAPARGVALYSEKAQKTIMSFQMHWLSDLPTDPAKP